MNKLFKKYKKNNKKEFKKLNKIEKVSLKIIHNLLYIEITQVKVKRLTDHALQQVMTKEEKAQTTLGIYNQHLTRC